MPSSSDQTAKKVSLEIRLIEAGKVDAELKRLAEAVQEEVRRLEEARAVSQETMQLEVNV